MEIRMDFYWLLHRHVTFWACMKRGRESKKNVQIYGAFFYPLPHTPLSLNSIGYNSPSFFMISLMFISSFFFSSFSKHCACVCRGFVQLRWWLKGYLLPVRPGSACPRRNRGKCWRSNARCSGCSTSSWWSTGGRAN